MLDGDGGDDSLVGGSGPDDLAGGLGNDTLNGVFRDDTFSQLVGRDNLIGGQRLAARPVPATPLDAQLEAESPQFLSLPSLTTDITSDDPRDTESPGAGVLTSIDAGFAGSLISEQLEL